VQNAATINYLKTHNCEDFMIEVGMIVSLIAMGVYFFKSTDLPQDLKERSTQHKTINKAAPSFRNIKISIPKEELKDTQFELSELKLQKQIKELKVLNLEIDNLTLEITGLEQQIIINNSKNAEIQSIIDLKLISLQSLHERVAALS
jgi:hypothetical protein